MHALRLLCFVGLICGLHALAQKDRSDHVSTELTLAQVQAFLPEAAALSSSGNPPTWEVQNSSQQTIALACLTAPHADKIVGYAGPNNILLLMSPSGEVIQTHWLHSFDTIDHVERVRATDRFWNQFTGRTLGSSSIREIDGVSGATLTSLAIAEAIELRLSGKRPSLRFPQTLTLEEAQGLFPDAHSLGENSPQSGLIEVIDANQGVVGFIMRTGPLVDDQIGYQGPTELLIALDTQQRVTKFKLRSSFDNEPYVRYTRMEASFWNKFVGKTLMELSQIDLAAEGVEGVSGATMTSMAAAETVRVAASRHMKELSLAQEPMRPARKWNWSTGEITTAGLALAVIPWSLSRLRGNRRWRTLWQAIVFVLLVGVSGNLISLALLAGWTRSLPPLLLAPGLALLVSVAVLMPACFGRNVYCDHVCPHGMAQQWLARWPRIRSGPKSGLAKPTAEDPLIQISNAPIRQRPGVLRQWMRRALPLSTWIVLAFSVGWILWELPNQLTIFEPFDVYAWRVGWSVSLGVWILSLVLAAFEPMGYCRLACPTGALLETVRRKRTSKRLQKIDMLWLALTLAAWSLYAVGAST